MGRKNINLKTYEDRHNNVFPHNPIKVIEKISNYVYFETQFGLCKKQAGNFGTCSYNLSSAIDKTDYLKKQLFSIYGDKYDYSLVIWKSSRDKITLICVKHGVFETNTNSMLQNDGGCRKCGNNKISIELSNNTKSFIEKANLIHNFKYDYSKTVYDRSFKDLTIFCPIHGEFLQRAGHHLCGHGCKECANIEVRKINSQNSPGWTLINWIKKAEKSKKFDNFKVYIIECWNDKEHFYKIGRTFQLIENRFKSKKSMPYKFKIVKVFVKNAEEIYNLEIELKKINKNNKYIPKLKFCGMYECFKII